jgi:hypothetical protein
MKRFNPYLNYSIALIFICMVSFLYFKMKSNDDFIFNIDKTVIPSESIEANISDEPRFPLPIVSVDRIQRPDLMALPALNQSDQYLHLALSETLNDGVAKLLSQTRLIEKIVATIDNLSRNYMAERMRPIAAIENSFLVERQPGGNDFILSNKSYDRYAFLVDQLAIIGANDLAGIYLRFYPLFQEAYEDLGYPNAYFNDRMIDIINHLIATPEVNDPIILHRPHVLYEFIHPELEALSSGQKILIRLGSRNSIKVKQFLIELKALIS